MEYLPNLKEVLASSDQLLYKYSEGEEYQQALNVPQLSSGQQYRRLWHLWMMKDYLSR